MKETTSDSVKIMRSSVSWGSISYLCLQVLAVTFVYYPTFLWMWERWFRANSYYSHGILVPLVSLFLVWRQRNALLAIPREPTRRWGFAGISAVLLLHLAGAWARIHFLSGISLVMVVGWLVLYSVGWSMTRRLAFPLFFLLFMVPAPLAWIASMTLQLKLLVTQISTLGVGWFGLPAVQEGSLVHLTNTTLTVGDPCSGLRSIISLLSLGTVYTYLSHARWPRKALLLLSTIPIAIGTNVVRVMITLFLADHYGDWTVTEGWFHEGLGILVFVLALIAFVIVGRLLRCHVQLSQTSV